MAVGLWGPRPSAFQRGQLVLRLHRLSLHPRRARAGWGSTPRAGWPFGRSAADLAGSAGNTADTLNSAARRSGGTGRRRGLKIPWPQGRSGSNPGSGTNRPKVLYVETIRPGYPDCVATRYIGKGKWEDVRIEFEFRSSDFARHRHYPDDCDAIVCWEDDWKDRPDRIEVIELDRLWRSFRIRSSMNRTRSPS